MEAADNSPDDQKLAQERILRIAAEMFMEQGYKATSIRKICERANVNVAMVNYYFGSKDGLYLAVIDFARQCERFGFGDESVDKSLPPFDRLRVAIELLVSNLLKPGRTAMLTRLIAWELVTPSFAIETIAERDIQPQHRFFAGLIRDITGDALDDDEVKRCVLSIIGQAVFYANGKRVHELAAPDITYDEQGIKQIAEHIYRFSAAALFHFPSRNKEKKEKN